MGSKTPKEKNGCTQYKLYFIDSKVRTVIKKGGKYLEERKKQENVQVIVISSLNILSFIFFFFFESLIVIPNIKLHDSQHLLNCMIY